MESTAGTQTQAEQALARARERGTTTYVGGLPVSPDGRYPLGAVLIAVQGVQGAQRSLTRLLSGSVGMLSYDEQVQWLAEVGL